MGGGGALSCLKPHHGPLLRGRLHISSRARTEAEGLTTQRRLAKLHLLFSGLLIQAVIHKYLLSSFCAPGTLLSMGVTEVKTHKNLCPHRAFLLVKEKKQQMTKMHSMLVK